MKRSENAPRLRDTKNLYTHTSNSWKIEPITICFCANDNYIRHTSVAIASILKNAKSSEHFHFYILHSNVSVQNQKRLLFLKNRNCQIDFIQMNVDDFKDFYVNKSMHVTLEAYFRFKIISLFPQLDRILYLDGDLLALKDLSDLYYTDMGDNWFGMVADTYCKNGRLNLQPYYNSGVLLFNLKKCRQDKVYDLLVKFDHSKFDLAFMDQDILNIVGQGHIYSLPEYYNQQIHPEIKGSYLEIKKHIRDIMILHYTTGTKPWGDYYPNSLQKYYFEYLKESPWRQDYLKIKLHRFRLFLCRHEKNIKNEKFKILGTTLFKIDHKKNGKDKYLFLGIPVWIKKQNHK